ncbi:MAG TPA: response regulator [Candidatus Cloacimonadota bacterium]|nr:response regulator [Candidatus Cloacimonadota bacterium]HQB41441.1 response regulator [Candidatus Cloacimonadota bacterium]
MQRWQLSDYKRKIIFKLLLILIITFTAVSSVNIFVFKKYLQEKEIDTLTKSVNNTINTLSKTYRLPIWNIDYDNIDALNNAILNNEEYVAINIFNEDFEFIAGCEKTLINNSAIIEDRTVPYNNYDNEKSVIKKNFQVYYNNQKIANVELFYTNIYALKQVNRSSFAISVTYLLLMLSLLFISYLFISTNILKPMISLSKTINLITQKSDYTIRLKTELQDEIGQLYNNFDIMLEEVHQRNNSHDKIKKELMWVQTNLTNIINYMPSILVNVNKNGEITQWNNAAASFFQISSSDAIGKSLQGISPEFNLLFKNFMTHKRSKLYNHQQINESIMNVHIYPIKSPELENIVILADDVTELENKNSQLQQAQRMESIGNLAGGVAHEINNMLSGIIGTLSIMKFNIESKKECSTEKIMEYHQLMESSASRAANIVQQLLSLSKKQDLFLAPIDLNTCLTNVTTICNKSFDKSVEIFTTPYEEPAISFASATHIEQILLNLCINATHAMTIMRDYNEEYGGLLNITISMIKADQFFTQLHPSAEPIEYWRILVADTGVGIEKELITKIFEPFYTTKNKDMGTGLGLTMVYNLIKQHHGFVDIFSEIGIGTNVYVYLPVHHMKFKASNIQKHEKIYKGEGTVLLVDDELFVRKMAREMLETCGYYVMTANNGNECLDIYKSQSHKIDLIILDMIMPQKSGKDTFIELKAFDENVKVLLTSGFKQDERIKNITNMGIKGFIQKPYTLEQLSKTVYDTITKKRF